MRDAVAHRAESEAEGPLLHDFNSAAARLSITERHLKELWARREIGAVKVGKLVRFRDSDLQEFIARNAQAPLPRGVE